MDVEIRSSYILLALKGILMVTAILLVSASTDILEVKPCELKKELAKINVDFTNPCKYDGILAKSNTLRNGGIAVLAVNFVLFISIPIFMLMEEHMKYKIGISITIFIVALVFVPIMMISYTDVLHAKEEKLDYVKLRKAMNSSLIKYYIADNISTENEISNNWNKFFIKYECCAVNQVQGTTNDFDNTPWCTTAGTCQTTASQIPRTCCKYVTETNYSSAAVTCHSAVNPGSYKPNCMIHVKSLDVVNKDGCQISLILISLLIIGTLELTEIILVLIVPASAFIQKKYEHKKKKKEQL